MYDLPQPQVALPDLARVAARPVPSACARKSAHERGRGWRLARNAPERVVPGLYGEGGQCRETEWIRGESCKVFFLGRH